MPMWRLVALRPLTALMTTAVLAAVVPAGATAAQLIGGRPEAAVAHAFQAGRSHRGQAIVSIRASTVSPGWTVVRAVVPARLGATPRRASAPRLLSTYYHRSGGREIPQAPPAAVQADLSRPFTVTVVYTGSGAESISAQYTAKSNCAGLGPFSDGETVSVTPMSWEVRYTVALDDVLSAVASGRTVAIVPRITFDARTSRLSAAEIAVRTMQDQGCSGPAVTSTCRTSFSLGGPDPAGQLALSPSGLQIGVPVVPHPTGACAPSTFTLGPSLWDSGATTALLGHLGLIGGTLPAHPYAPVTVRWPGGSAQHSQGFVTSPCQDDPGCMETFGWHGTVSLHTG